MKIIELINHISPYDDFRIEYYDIIDKKIIFQGLKKDLTDEVINFIQNFRVQFIFAEENLIIISI